MKGCLWIVVCSCVLFVATMNARAGAESFAVVSGNAPIGQTDPNTTVRGADVVIGGVSYSAAAVSPQQAHVITPNGGWVALPGSAWIGVASGLTNAPTGGYVYSTTFQLPTGYSQAGLSLTFTSDNFTSVYLNGHLLGSTTMGSPPFEFAHLFSAGTTDPTYFSATNILEFQLCNVAGAPSNPSGLLFGAQISYVPAPEPSSVISILCGVGGLAGLLRWREGMHRL